MDIQYCGNTESQHSLFVCKCVLPPGDNPIAVNKYTIIIIIIIIINIVQVLESPILGHTTVQAVKSPALGLTMAQAVESPISHCRSLGSISVSSMWNL
jgi:hypothetical protein